MTNTATSATSIPVLRCPAASFIPPASKTAGAGLPRQRQCLRSGRLNSNNSAIVNGAAVHASCQGNSTAGFPSGLKQYPHVRFMPRFGFAYRPFGDDKWAIRGGVGPLQHQHAGFQLLLSDRHGAGLHPAVLNTYDPTTHAIGYQWPQIYAGAGGAAAHHCTAPTTLAPPTAPTGKTPTPSSGR